MIRRAFSTGLAMATATSLLLTGTAATATPLHRTKAPAKHGTNHPKDDARVAAAKAAAAALARQVDQLNAQAEIASEDYDAAFEQLGKATQDYLTVQEQLGQAQAGDAANSDSVKRQTAALYEAGGPTPLYAAALNGEDLGDVVERISMAGDVLRTQKSTGKTNAARTAVLATLNAHLAATATLTSRLRAQAARKRVEVTGLLAEQSHLLASANANVKTVLVQLQQEAQAKAAQKFANELATARAAALQNGLLLGGAAAPTAAAATALQAAESREGTPYVWGATGPGEFDCSGLTSWAYAQAGLGLPRTSREQWYVGHHVALSELQPGDLLFWASDANNPATIHHVAIYAGNGYMLAAPHSGATVALQRVYLGGDIGATRPTG
jgi:cell wall-associated NlpC family hydrolase